MDILEKDAGTLWCSEVQVAIAAGDRGVIVVTNRGDVCNDLSVVSKNHGPFSCLGSRCAKWAWTDEEQTRGECGLKRG